MAFTVNGELVEDSVVRAEIKALRPHYEAAPHGLDPIAAEAQLREWSRENVIERVLLRQEAVSEAGSIPPDEAVDRLVAKITSKISPPKHKEISEYYRKNKERFFRPEQVRAAHIFKAVEENAEEAAALAEIEQIQRELNNGGRFEDLPGYGDLGFVARGQMAREFDDLLFALAENGVSGIFRSAGGFHILKVYERKPPGISDFDEVREALAEALHEQKKERAIENFLDRLKAKAVIRELL